jgi:hypothetical protein
MDCKEEIKNYVVSYFAGGKCKSSCCQYKAIIALMREDDSLIGCAYFHRDQATMPDTDSQSPEGHVWCHFTAEDYPHILDLLRNEEPVFVEYLAGDNKLAAITTSFEPAGEGERCR